MGDVIPMWKRYKVTQNINYATGVSGVMESVDGVDWFDAPIPPAKHVCWAQTRGFLSFGAVYRCACGAISRDGSYWMERNARKYGMQGDPHFDSIPDESKTWHQRIGRGLQRGGVADTQHDPTRPLPYRVAALYRDGGPWAIAGTSASIILGFVVVGLVLAAWFGVI